MSKLDTWFSRCEVSKLNSENEQRYEITVAVFCYTPNEYMNELKLSLYHQGYQLLKNERIHSLTNWFKAKKGPLEHEVLIRKANQFQPVMISEPLLLDTEKDKKVPSLDLVVEHLEEVIPLNMQMGIHPKLTVPENLKAHIFDQPEAIKDEISHYGSLLEVPKMQTYAILDAAKMPNLLTSILENTGLKYQSLFQGDAQEELKEVAPYLAQLGEDNAFTRQLFTGPEGLNGLWDRELGSYIRSRASFEAVRKHFRKFTRMQGEKGKWYFLRFWEKTVIPALQRGAPAELGNALLNDGSCEGQSWLLIKSDSKQVTTYKRGRWGKHTKQLPSLKISTEVLTALNSEVNNFQNIIDIAAAVKYLPSRLKLPSREGLLPVLELLREVGFSSHEKRQKALGLFILASQKGRNKEASNILRETVQGPAIRLWHLQNLIEEEV